MKTFILRGKTLKGKNRIRELGFHWVLIRESDTVLFAKRGGLWLLVAPIENAQVNMPKSRWIHSTHDVDFEVVK